MHEFSFAKGKVSDGLIISADVAHRLNVGVGDKVILSTHFMKEEKEISGITQEIGFSQGYLIENLPIGCTA